MVKSGVQNPIIPHCPFLFPCKCFSLYVFFAITTGKATIFTFFEFFHIFFFYYNTRFCKSTFPHSMSKDISQFDSLLA